MEELPDTQMDSEEIMIPKIIWLIANGYWKKWKGGSSKKISIFVLLIVQWLLTG